MADVLDLQGEAGEFEDEVEDDERKWFVYNQEYLVLI